MIVAGSGTVAKFISVTLNPVPEVPLKPIWLPPSRVPEPMLMENGPPNLSEPGPPSMWSAIPLGMEVGAAPSIRTPYSVPVSMGALLNILRNGETKPSPGAGLMTPGEGWKLYG